MVTRTKTEGKSPDQLRRERAQVEYHQYRFTLANVKLRTPAGAVRLVGVCYVVKPRECYTVRLDEQLRPVHCSCPDHTRRQLACKHCHMVSAFITGDVPELPEFGGGAFKIEVEAALLASLEEQERRHAQALADRDRLWQPA